MLKLTIGDGSIAQSASIPVRWCIDTDTQEFLKECESKEFYLLVVTVANNREMSRSLVPLKNMMTYIPFQKPGVNKVYATIVWSLTDYYPALWEKYLARKDGMYLTSVVDYDGSFYEKNVSPSHDFIEIEVDVPSELFAKEPPRWEKRWVNFWFETKPKDQCQYRRRRFLAYSVQLVVVPLWIVFLTVVRSIIGAGAMLCGFRGVDLKPILHPWRDKIHDILDNVDGKNLFFPKGSYREDKRLFFLLPFAPVWIIAASAVIFFTIDFETMMEIITFVAIYVMGLPFLFLFVIFILLKIPGLGKFYEAWVEHQKEKQEQRELALARERKREQGLELQQLLCGDSTIVADIAAIPLKRQTISLKFKGFKANVCKPMAS